MWHLERKRRVPDDEVIRRRLHVVVGPESEVVVLTLRRRVDPSTFIAAERPLLVVAGHDVLPQLGADCLQPVTKVTDDREIPQDGMLPLQKVMRDPSRESYRKDEPKHRVHRGRKGTEPTHPAYRPWHVDATMLQQRRMPHAPPQQLRGRASRSS